MAAQLTTEEIQEAWESHEEDITVNLETGEAWHSGALIVSGDDGGGSPDYVGIRGWMKDQGYYPNVWLINDHGNVDLISINETGTETVHWGGLV